MCKRTRREAVRKTRHPILTRLVLPSGTDLVYSQDRIAKKKAPRTRSAACTRAVFSPWSLVSAVRNWKNFRRNFGVMAFCRSGGGSVLSNAFSRDRMVGSNWELPST